MWQRGELVGGEEVVQENRGVRWRVVCRSMTG
jgi:hypothetical protein